MQLNDREPTRFGKAPCIWKSYGADPVHASSMLKFTHVCCLIKSMELLMLLKLSMCISICRTGLVYAVELLLNCLIICESDYCPAA